MEAVHLVHRHEVQVLFDLVHREEMAADIQEETPIAKARLVSDVHGRNRPCIGHGRCAVDSGGQELFQRLDGIEQARPRRGLDHDLIDSNCQCISLLTQGLILQEIKPGGLPRPGCSVSVDTETGGEGVHHVGARLPESGIEMDTGAKDRKTTFTGRERRGIRNQVECLAGLVTA